MKRILIPICFIFFIFFTIRAIAVKNNNEIPVQVTDEVHWAFSYHDINIEKGDIKNIIINGNSICLTLCSTRGKNIKIDVKKSVKGNYDKKNLETFLELSSLKSVINDGSLFLNEEKAKNRFQLDFSYNLVLYLPEGSYNFSVEADYLDLKVLCDYHGSFSLDIREGNIIFNNIIGALDIKGNNTGVRINNGCLMPGSSIRVMEKGNIYLNADLSPEGTDYVIETGKGSIFADRRNLDNCQIIADGIIIKDTTADDKDSGKSGNNGKATVYLKAVNGIIKLN